MVSTSNASSVLALKDTEEELVEEIEAYIEAENPEEGALVRGRFMCLRALGEAISGYPSVRDVHTLRGEAMDEEKLVNSFRVFSTSSRLLHIPTKVVAARGFFVAKYHAFSLLSILTKGADRFRASLRTVLFTIVCALMAEEVYFSCLNDPSFPEKIKIRLVNDLISLWDSGTDPRSIHHLPALTALWTARDSAPPSFGTMDGSSELIRLSIDLGEDWHEFLMDHSSDNETKWALEEFLFGLSYEEIRAVRGRLSRFGVSAVDHDEIRSYLGSNPAYQIVKNTDPRGIYDFYVDRRDAAAFRRRIAAPGPKTTLEEIYLKYRIIRT
jgi:hypothetical protein